MGLQRVSRDSGVRGAGSGSGQGFISSGNPSRGVWRGLGECGKAAQGFGGVISSFACFLAAVVGV